jgi:hypothetical protein
VASGRDGVYVMRVSVNRIERPLYCNKCQQARRVLHTCTRTTHAAAPRRRIAYKNSTCQGMVFYIVYVDRHKADGLPVVSMPKILRATDRVL